MTDAITLEDLTPELHLRVLSFLDIPTLLHFAQTSSKFQETSSNSDAWVNRFNQLWPTESKPLFSEDSRRFCKTEMLHRPRLRFDGAYVARCVYTRRVNEGESLTDPRTYMRIVYHRIVRFMPDNTAFMVLIEKGSKASARESFLDLIQGDLHPQILEKYKQLNRCKWRTVDVDETGATINMTYFDGKLCWGAKLHVCSGTARRQPGSRVQWLNYKFWDPHEVWEFRRRELYRERQDALVDLRRAQLEGTEEWVNQFLDRISNLSAAIQCVTEHHESEDMDQVPEELTKDIKLWEDHFPVMRFGYSSILAHLF